MERVQVIVLQLELEYHEGESIGMLWHLWVMNSAPSLPFLASLVVIACIVRTGLTPSSDGDYMGAVIPPLFRGPVGTNKLNGVP